MGIEKFRAYLYQKLVEKRGEIYAECEKVSRQIGIPNELKGQIGLSGGMSGMPAAPIRKDVRKAMEEAGAKTIHLSKLADELRFQIKQTYGDDYDAILLDTCEASLWLSFDALFSPPLAGKGDNYQACYIAPYERHMHHQAGYGRPFPSKYKDLTADRGVTAGEMGLAGKRQNNLSTVIVPLEGAKYECHGSKYWPLPLLAHVNPEKSYEKLAKAAARHSSWLVGIASMGMDTPGYGYGEKDDDGTPKLLKLMAQIAKEYNIVYLIDDAAATPIIGLDIRKIGADLIVFSMDKVTGAPICGLIIGREEVMIPLRRAAGMHTDRTGTGTAYGKAWGVIFDPGKEGLAGAIQAIKVLREQPHILTDPIDGIYEIVLEEMNDLNPEIAEHLIVTKSYNALAVEINYQDTWSEDRIGFPIFGIEDAYAGTNILTRGVAATGIVPTIDYDANILFSPKARCVDEDGQFIEEYMRYGVKAFFQVMNIIWKYWKNL